MNILVTQITKGWKIMNEYDMLIMELRNIIKKGSYCEDNKLRLKNCIKYEVYNLLEMHDKKFIKNLHKELEYNERKDD